MNDGFGWNFYGFFVFAVVWCAAYFGWALAVNRRERTARRLPPEREDG